MPTPTYKHRRKCEPVVEQRPVYGIVLAEISGKFLTGYRVSKDENNNSLSFSYKPDKHWNFDISWMYIFSKRVAVSIVELFAGEPYTTDRYIRNNANMVTLSVSYSADFGSIFRSGSRSLNNSDSGSSLLKM